MAIFAGGHLYDGGMDIRLLDTTADVTLRKAVATYHEDRTTSPPSTRA
jgi:hypothetical protein